ncbi:MAG: putative sulfatase [Candidatus Hydrogenedentota bacterium]
MLSIRARVSCFLGAWVSLLIVSCGSPNPSIDTAPERTAGSGTKAAAAGAGGSKPVREPVPQRDVGHTNFLLITVDALRADHLHCYGYPKETSPVLDALAAEGALFEKAFAPKGSTWPSLATILTGLHPVTHGVRYNGMRLASEHDTMAEVLRPLGYDCAVFISNGGQQRWEGFDVKSIIRDEPRDAGVTEQAVAWLKEHADDKFFLWVHYFAPHGPYTPSDEFNRFTDPNYRGTIDGSYDTLTRVFTQQQNLKPEDVAHVKGLYDGEVLFTDTQMGLLLDELKAHGVYDDTLVVFSADHGEELHDHHRYFHHQASLYDGTIQVPLIFKLKDKIPPGLREKLPVSIVDIAPTVLELLGVGIPKEYEGTSLVPVFRDEKLARGPVFGEWGDKMLYIRTDEYKYIYNPSGFHPPVKREREEANEGGRNRRRNEHALPMKERELYKVSEDPGEQQEISEAAPEVVAELEKELASFREKYGWRLENKAEEQLQKDLDPQTREELEALGYVL